MTKKTFLKGLGIVLLSALVAFGVSHKTSQPYVGGSFNSTTIDFAQGLSLNGTSFVDGSGNLNAFGTTNVIGDSAKTAYNKLAGYTKIDLRPTGGSTNDYALQIRGNSAKTSGTFLGADNESHLVASGTASLMSTRGVAVVDTGYTMTGGTLIGTYGQARADGTVAGSSFVTGLYGLVEASAAITASHVSSLWLDSHQANAVTGSHQLLYMTNNGAATMDEAIYIYGGDKITNLFTLNTVGGMVAGPSTAASGTPVKIKIDVGGTAYYINAYPTSNN